MAEARETGLAGWRRQPDRCQKVAGELKEPRGSEQHVVRFENVGLRYGQGTEVLCDLTFRIEPHSFSSSPGRRAPANPRCCA